MSVAKNLHTAERWLRTAEEDLQVWLEHGATLDKFYIPTRYPNGLPDLTPGQVYRSSDASRAIEAATVLVSAAKKWFEKR